MSNHTDRKKEILLAVLDNMDSNHIEDTPQNRSDFLEGIRDAWMEDPDNSFEKMMYQIALKSLLGDLAVELRS